MNGIDMISLQDWAPMPPDMGPPLPQILGQYWPWYEAEGAHFRVSGLAISPTEVEPGQEVSVQCTVANAGKEAGEYTVHLSGDFTNQQTITLEPWKSQTVTFILTPSVIGTYHVTVDGLSGSFKAVEEAPPGEEEPPVEPSLVTFSVKISDIPDYAAGSYQWFISYGGYNWGMKDPQGGVWTPIDEAITISGPQIGTLRATLMEGPFKQWSFTAGRKFQEGKEYNFNLSAGILASGVALTNLTVEPDYFHLGESTTISVTAINSEDSNEKYEVVFIVNNEEVAKKTVDLGPGESKDISIEVTPTYGGTYTVHVETLVAKFKVIEPYPEISSPEVVSAEFLPKSQWASHHAGFQGVILLPEPGEDQSYALLAYLNRFTYEGYSGGGQLTYIGSGRWSFVGGAMIPYYSPHQLCPAGYRTWYRIRCPICGPNILWQSLISEAEARSKFFLNHCQPRCSGGDTRHCGLSPADGILTIEQEPQYYATQGPCAGDQLTLTFDVLLMERYKEGVYTKTRVAKTWENVPAGISFIAE